MADRYEQLENLVKVIDGKLDDLEAEADKRNYPELGTTAKRSNCKDEHHFFLAKQWLALWKEKVQYKAEMYKIAFPDATIEFNEDGTQFASV